MKEQNKKLFFVKHSKSSAALISLGIHAVLIVIAVSFVAVTVIQKEDKVFEAKPVKRPKMQLKKLQVPVNIKKKKLQKPKLRKRIVVQPKLNQTMPDIKMPEISGVKGGLGSAGTGLGGVSSIGFTMPEINIFGVKGKGEKIFIILDSSPAMMTDQMGGIPAYTIIKDELVEILGKLSPTVLFNIAVYEDSRSVLLFPDWRTANAGNIAAVKTWLDPLNAVSKNMGDNDYGVKTLGQVSGSKIIYDDFGTEKLKTQRSFYRPLMVSMKDQADVVFLLSQGWGGLWQDVAGGGGSWSESKSARWNEAMAKSEIKLKEENVQRRGNGQAPRVFPHKRAMVSAYFPGVEQPPVPTRYTFTAQDIVEAMESIRAKTSNTKSLDRALGKKKDAYNVNVIHFVGKGGSGGRNGDRFKQLSNDCEGEYRTLEGLEQIQSAAMGNEG